MKRKEVLGALAALAQQTRLDIFRILVRCGPRGIAAGEIAARLGLPAPTLSFHIAALSHGGLVRARRESRSIFYSANYAAMQGLLGYLSENCCAEEPACCDAQRPAAGDAGARLARA
jgi:ArsR family transcriptional regulator